MRFATGTAYFSVITAADLFRYGVNLVDEHAVTLSD